MFSKDFIFGVATSSYQIEGTHHQFKSIWDMDYSKIDQHDHGIIACNHVELYKEDIKIIKNLGVDSYRMSFSWARLELDEDLWNKEGIKFYIDLLKSLKDEGIKISATLYHWDMPLWLYEKGIGFDHQDIVPHFLRYAKKVFELFDDYVDQWSTINEPWCVSFVGYLYGGHAPWIKDLSKAIRAQYHTLIIHQEVYEYYHKHYQKPMGIVLNLTYVYKNNDEENSRIAQYFADIYFNRIFLDPLFYGTYPKNYIDRLKELKIDVSFIDDMKLSKLKNQLDFLGVNTYSHFVSMYDQNAHFLFARAQTKFKKTDMGWDINPNAFLDLMNYIKENYPKIPIYITENGAAFQDQLLDEKVDDQKRVAYYKAYLKILSKIHQTHNIHGYFAWSLMDNFEWAYGYQKRFGIVYVDFNTQKRVPKKSYYFYQKVIQNRKI